MKSLQSFLHPKRKENLRFALSDAFVGEDGKPIEWEMRQLSAAEGMELTRALDGKNYMDVMTAYVAKSLVYPNLHDKELLEALGKREGRPVFKAADALVCMLSDAELGNLINRYTQLNELTTGISELISEAKN